MADLEYRITGGLGETIFPKRLPHLYRGETLSVYGRYPPGTRELALSITGEGHAGELKELIFREDVNDVPTVSSELALQWASQKLFHLISENTLRPSEKTVAEIRRLSDRYNLYVPYM